MNDERIIISEEKVFGDNFIVIRRKYAPEDYSKRALLFNKKE